VGSGNFADESAKAAQSGIGYLDGYRDGFAYTSPVGSFGSNPLGLFDMGGNVEQWCQDLYIPEYDFRVFRGASWRDFKENFLRSSHRYGIRPATRYAGLGFRCVLEVPGGSGG